ncbi:hypothetical protein H4R33_002532 [Dimargaris cristalligena]|nr:hypothetical protein H4R33_002532 [Dimargaris cristalligena]
MSLSAPPHSGRSSGLKLLLYLFNPSQNLLGHRVIRHLPQQEQFQLAAVCRQLRPLVTAAYQLRIDLGPEVSPDSRLALCIHRYRPAVRRLCIRPGDYTSPASIETMRLLLSQLTHVQVIVFNINVLADWPATIASCLVHFARPPDKLRVVIQNSRFPPNQSYQSIEDQYFSDALLNQLGRIKKLEVFPDIFGVRAYDTGAVLQLIAPFTGLKQVILQAFSPRDNLDQAASRLSSRLTRLSLKDGPWNLALLFGPRPPIFQQLVQLEVSGKLDTDQLRALRNLTPADYPHLAKLGLYFGPGVQQLSDHQQLIFMDQLLKLDFYCPTLSYLKMRSPAIDRASVAILISRLPNLQELVASLPPDISCDLLKKEYPHLFFSTI